MKINHREVAETMTVVDLMAKSHATARDKGWWDPPRGLDQCLLLAHCEISEAVEALRDGADVERAMRSIGFEDTEAGPKPVGFASEIADVFIRLADACAHFGVPLAEAIALKLDYNEKRPYRHGGKSM